MATAATLAVSAPTRVFVTPAPGGRCRDAAALASQLDAHGGRRDDAEALAVDGGDARPALAASLPLGPRLLQFAEASGTPARASSSSASWSSPARSSAADKTLKMLMPTKKMKIAKKKKTPPTQGRRQPSVDVLIDWTAKLLVLPFVGVSLCGALTLMVGVQWVEAVRRRELSRYGTSLASLWALMPALSLPSHQLLDSYGRVNDADDAVSDNGDNERRPQARSPSARPVKRQRSGTGAGDGNETDENALVSRQPKPSSPLTGVSPRPTNAAGSRRRRRRRRVFIWDLDETLVLFASLYTGSFAQTHGKEEAPGVALGEQMMTFLLAMLERHFFFGDLHDTDVDHISCAEGARCLNCRRLRSASSASSVLSQETGELQGEAENAHELERKTRYRRIRDIYEQRGRVDFLHDDQSEWFAIRAALVQAIDSFSTGWLQEARQVLALIEASNVATSSDESGLLRNASTVSLDGGHDGEEDGPVADTANDPTLYQEEEEENEEEEVENVNVLVTNTQLVPALCKCLVYELDAFFPIERVYSSAKVHKYRCFEAIMAKYRAESRGDSADGDEDVAVEFVAIGDGLEEEQVSLALGLEFHKIRSLVDLRRLRYDLQLVGRPPASAFASHSSPVASTGARDSHTPAARTPVSTMAVAVDTQEQ